MKNFLLLSLLLIFIGACSSTGGSHIEENRVKLTSLNEYIQTAEEELSQQDYLQAALTYDGMLLDYPFGDHLQEQSLNRVYAYYKNDDVSLTVSKIDEFINAFPQNPDVAYVMYLRGIANMEEAKKGMTGFFGVDTYDRDPSFQLQAFKDFQTLIKLYPSSVYVADATKRMQAIKVDLARHELNITEFLFDREQYVASSNRAQGLLQQFPDSPSIERALEIAYLSAKELGLNESAQKHRQVLLNTFPENKVAQ